MAGVYGKMGRREDGIRALAEALALVAGNGERKYEAELYRLKGELLMNAEGGMTNEDLPTSSVHRSEEAEACFRRALEVARQQQAKSLELRAAVSLARLWRTQNKEAEARHLLGEVYSWFTEGFDTKDLQEAEALLIALGGTVSRPGEEGRKTAGGPQEAHDGENPEQGEHVRRTAAGPSWSFPTPLSLTVLSLPDPRPDPHSPTPGLPSPSPSRFHRDGEYWTLVFQGTVARIKDTRGMQYLAHLLQSPGQEFSAIALAADAPDFATSSLTGRSLLGETQDPAATTVHIAGFTDAGEVLDPQAKAAYRQRLTELQAELEEAQEFNDVGRMEKLRAELEFVTQELAGAVGLRGRARKAASPQERARVNVTRAIRTAIARVTEAHPALGQYLTRTIKTGTFCAYVPTPHTPPTWQF
jgi:hypothetical protein